MLYGSQGNVLLRLVHLLRTDQLEVKQEALWALVNITSGGTPDQVKAVADAGAVSPMCDILSDS